MGRIKTPEIDRFNSFIKLDKKSDCWLWQGSLDKNGYGVFSSTVPARAHRWSYKYYKGKLIKGLTIDHLCRVRNCVNPNHLEQVTVLENILRGKEANRKDHCRHGHPYKENGFRNSVGRQACRICCAENTRRWRENLIITDEGE